MRIRDAVAADFPAILRLNQESVHFLSPLDAAGLERLHGQAAYHRVAEEAGEVAGFLLALREGADYHSPNYRWFMAHYASFLYVDRVVVSAAHQGRGVGRRLYEDLFDVARSLGAPRITLEYDLEPPNPPSQRFHERFGFQEVGSQRVGPSQKRVSLQAVELHADVLALAGSLRAASINAAFCRTVTRLAPASMRVRVFDGLGALPLFNPDLEADAPAAVREFRRRVDGCAALLIASPEYAHGVSGVIKNALDWLVSFEGTVNKPVALVNTSPRAHHAYDALAETLRTMSLVIVPAASITVPLLGTCVTEQAMLASPELSARVRQMLAALAAHLAVNSRDEPGRFALT